MYSRLEAYKARQIARYGVEKCDFSELDRADSTIKSAYESGMRMNFNYYAESGLPIRGYVGITTGWKPVFIRIDNIRSTGGSDILTDKKAMGYSNTKNPKGRY